MKKRIFASLLFALTMSAGMFAEANQTLLINGQEVNKVVSAISFDGDNVVLHFGNETESHDMNKVSLALDYSTGLEDLQVFSFNGKIEGGILTVSGLEAGTPILIYALNGVTEISAKADNEGNAVIDIESLGGGIHILRAGNNCVKFVK